MKGRARLIAIGAGMIAVAVILVAIDSTWGLGWAFVNPYYIGEGLLLSIAILLGLNAAFESRARRRLEEVQTAVTQ